MLFSRRLFAEQLTSVARLPPLAVGPVQDVAGLCDLLGVGMSGSTGFTRAAAVAAAFVFTLSALAPPGTAVARAAGHPPAGRTPPASLQATPQAKAIGPMAVATHAIELRVEGVDTAAEIAGRKARPGYEFVIVSTSWKNIIPLKAIDKKARNPQGVGGLGGFGNNRRPSSDPADLTMEPTKYIVPMLKKQVWLLTDGRFADTVDTAAQNATPEHLPPGGFSIAKLDDIVRGTLVFEAPAAPKYRAFQFYDNTFGHALIVLNGSTPPAAAPTLGPAGQNELIQLAVANAAFAPADGTTPPGLRRYVVGLRGISRSPENIVDLQFSQFVFAQTDRGCVAQPERKAGGLTRPFGDVGSFPPTGPNEGQVAFLVPDDTKSVRVIVAPAIGTQIVLPAGADFTPSWPAPSHTIQDGTTMKVHILPAPERPESLKAAAAGREQVLLDVVVENMKTSQGIEFQGMQQLRLAGPDGSFITPSPLSGRLPCRLDGPGVIPAGGARRFVLVYDVPAGMPRRLQYRGFEKDEEFVNLK